MIEGKVRGMIGALLSLRPGAQWSMNEEDYDSIIWLEPEDGMTKPSREEVETEIQRINALYDRNEYQRLRAAEYPDFHDYLDGIVKGDQAQIQAYVDACLAVKAKYPKPGDNT